MQTQSLIQAIVSQSSTYTTHPAFFLTLSPFTVNPNRFAQPDSAANTPTPQHQHALHSTRTPPPQQQQQFDHAPTPLNPDTFFVDSVALEGLQAGDWALLQGQPLQEALRHYMRAHVFGFLPSMLVSYLLVLVGACSV